MKRKCELCGGLFNEFDMMSYNTGRRTAWVCWDCYKKSQYEVTKSEIHRRTKLARINEERKRYK